VYTTGRPPKFETPEELEKEIDAYFEKCVAEPFVFNGEVLRDGKGNPVMNRKVPTTAGLALHLGFADRQSLYDQKGRSEEFSCIIKRAITAIETSHEENLQGTTPTGSIFWLKNHKWIDKQEVVSTNTNAEVDLSKIDPMKREALTETLLGIFGSDKKDED
jgi:hypothetical protein